MDDTNVSSSMPIGGDTGPEQAASATLIRIGSKLHREDRKNAIRIGTSHRTVRDDGRV
jgi:hypothetical protein